MEHHQTCGTGPSGPSIGVRAGDMEMDPRRPGSADGCCMRMLTEREAVDALRAALGRLPPGLHHAAQSLGMFLHAEMLDALAARRELAELRGALAKVRQVSGE